MEKLHALHLPVPVDPPNKNNDDFENEDQDDCADDHEDPDDYAHDHAVQDDRADDHEDPDDYAHDPADQDDHATDHEDHDDQDAALEACAGGACRTCEAGAGDTDATAVAAIVAAVQASGGTYPQITVELEGTTCSAFLDSMAGVNLLRRDLLHKIEEKTGPIPRLHAAEAGLKVQPALGDQSELSESVLLTVSIAGRRYEVEMFVAELQAADILLGIPFCDATSTCINFASMEITLHMGEETAFNIPFDQGEEDRTRIASTAVMSVLPSVLFTPDLTSILDTVERENLKGLEPAELQQEEKAKLDALVHTYADIFKEPGVPPVRVEGEVMTIEEVPGSRPVSRPCPPIPRAAEQQAKEVWDDLVRKGIAYPSNSPYGAPLLLVPKKREDGTITSWRHVHDYRMLNNQTLKHRYPLPDIQRLVETAASKGRIYSGTDLTSGFWQIRMDPESEEKAAVTTPWGTYNLKVMVMGLAKIQIGLAPKDGSDR